jgi:hypothetical protein
MSLKKSASIWKHFKVCWQKKENPDDTPSLTEPEITIGKYDKRRMCNKCNIHVLDHPKEGYRHIKLCDTMTPKERVEIISSCDETEREKYKSFWDKSK